MERLPEICTEFQALLPLYVGSDLDPAEQEAVQLHLKDCAECRALAQRGERARAAFTHDADQTSGFSEARLWSGVRTQLLAEGLLDAPRSEPAVPQLELVRPRWQTWVSSAAAAAVVITLGALQFGGSSQPATTVPAAQPLVSSEFTPSEAPAVALEVQPVGLRRAAPDEERLMDTALPYQEVLFTPSGGSSGGATLVGGQAESRGPRVIRTRRIR